MDLRLQRVAAWGGVAMLVFFGIFFMLIGGLVPPIPPTASAQEVARFFIDHEMRIRFGIAGTLFAACLGLPWLAVICLRIQRVERKWGVLSVTQMFAAVVFVPGFLFPLMVLAAAAFRPEQRSPELTQALNDVFWLPFVGIVGTLVVQAVVLAIASFVDHDDPPSFPRWFGYLNIWYAILSVPGGAIVLFNDGPLAWNGIFAFWIPLVGFTVWIAAVTFVLLRSIGVEQVATQDVADAP